MRFGVGLNFGDGSGSPIDDGTAVNPPALATDGYLERYMSTLGIRSWTNHDETDDEFASPDAAANAAVLRDAKIYGGGLLAGRLALRYSYSLLATVPMMEEIWAVLVLRTLCFRRGNPPPTSLELRYQEIVQRDGMLDEIVKGKIPLTDADGNPIRPKNANIPSWSNLQVDRRFAESTIRVVTGSSDVSPNKLGTKYDRHNERE